MPNGHPKVASCREVDSKIYIADRVLLVEPISVWVFLPALRNRPSNDLLNNALRHKHSLCSFHSWSLQQQQLVFLHEEHTQL
jgi:hypothetical protein